METIRLTLGNYPVQKYEIFVENPTECSLYSASELAKYLHKATGAALPIVYKKSGAPKFVLSFAEKLKDGFEIKFDGDDLLLTGNNERSLLYAVYELLERIGWRFFSSQSAYRSIEKGPHLYACEKLISSGDVQIPSDVCIKQEAVIDYRDGFSFAVKDPDFCAKMRINAQTWETREITAQFGGAKTFSGRAGHTFSPLVPIAEYGKTNPEFFAEIDGVRKVNGTNWDNSPQLCLTNFDSVPVVIESLKKLMQEKPSAEYVSVSQNDNRLFCQCEKCKKSYEKFGYFGTLINYVNEVAQEFEKFYPTIKIHTYAYSGTDDVNETVRAHKNIMVQYCPSKACRNHTLDDPNCPVNARIYKDLQTLAKVTDEVFIYDYRACLKYSMLTFTDYFKLRQSMKAYVDCNVKGIFSEMCIHTLNQPTLEELRAYLFGKLTWNPYMSDEEYNRHMNEFLRGYYGEGWQYIREYLEKWCSLDEKMHYTSFYAPMIGDDLKYLRDENGNIRFADFVKKEELKSFCDWVNERLDRAKELAVGGEKERIEIVRTSIIWYELFHTMKGVMENGTEEEKTEMTARCKNLCSRMRKYQMKYTTFIAMGNITYMYDDFSMPVSEWRYVGNIAGDSLD